MEQEEFFKTLAAQLRRPTGEMGLETAEKMNIGNEAMNREAIRALDLQPNERILELGFGNGHFARDILETAPDIKYTGCDYSETMVDEAIIRNKDLVDCGRATFIHGTAHDLPSENSVFEKVLGVNIIYFWENPLIELKEIKRVLTKGGKLILGIRTDEFMNSIPVTAYGFHIRNKESISRLLAQSGFEVLSIEESTSPGNDFQGKPIQMGAWTVVAISTN